MTPLKKIFFGLAAVLAPLALSADEQQRAPHEPKGPRNPRMQQTLQAPENGELQQGSEPRKPRRHFRGGEQGSGLLAGLELSEEQEKKLEAGAPERQKKEEAALKKLEEAREAFAALEGEARNDSNHLGKLRSAYAALKDAERKLEDQRFEASLELRAALDQGQVKKLGERHAKRKAARANKPQAERKERGPIQRPERP